MTISFEEPGEAADGLEKVTVSFEEPEEAADGLEKVTISFEELEEAADGLEEVTVSFEEPEEDADGVAKGAVSLGEPEAVTGSPEDCKIHSDICCCMHIFLCLAAFVLLAKRAQSEEVPTNLEFVFLMWRNPTEFDAVATPFTQNDTEET